MTLPTPASPDADDSGHDGDADDVRAIALDRLRAHPMNSNVMPADRLDALAAHIERSGHYPPLIVRPAPDEPDAYQLLDGHHRAAVLQRLGHATARCAVWRVDDEAALTLLATLNRLEGADDPRRRAALVGALSERFGRTPAELARLLPESSADVKKLLALREPRPRPAAAPAMADLPTALHLFLTAPQRQRFEHAVGALGGDRERAVMRLIDLWEATTDDR